MMVPMSKKALERAIMLAKLDEKLVINVLTVAEVTLLPLERNVNLEKAKESMLEVEEKLKAIPNKTETYVLEGHPAQTIEEFAEQNNVDLIIMGSRELSGLKEIFLGSVSYHVIHQAKSEVLIVK